MTTTTAPALFNHAKQVFEAMANQAQEDRDGNRYYEGALTRLVTAEGFSNPYYTSITKALKAMDCIRQGRRGGGGIGSIWFLIQPPTLELFQAFAADDTASPAAKTARIEELEAALRAINNRIAQLELEINLLKARLEATNG